MSSPQAYSSTASVEITIGTWNKTDASCSQPDSPEIIVSREEVNPKLDNYSSAEMASPSSFPPPYSTYNKEYFSPEELHSNGEPLTLARFMFQYGFFFFPFWLAGIYILLTPLRPTPQWELGKTEEEKAYLLKVLRETELKWARRCSNAKGQLGQNNLDDTNVFRPCYFTSPTGGSITNVCPGKPLAICCGSNHTIILLRSTLSSRQEIWSCGDSKYAQPDFELSENSPDHSLVFQRLDNMVLSSLRLHPEQHEPNLVAASWNTTFTVFRPTGTVDGRTSRDILVSFGSNELGNLGLGLMPHELPSAFTPLQIQLWELFLSTYGDELSGFQIIHLVAGVRHIIIVVRLYVGDLDILRVLGWGSCRHGQLGQTPQCKDHILSRPSYLPLDAEIGFFALGNQHSILLRDSGRIKGLGSNRKGQLDGLDDIFSGIQIGTTWRGSYVVYRRPNQVPESWHIFSTEKGKKRQPEHSNNSSTQIIQFPFDTATRQFVKLACGSEHVLVCLKRVESPVTVTANEVWGWGWNEHGNLGVGSTESINDPMLIYRTSNGEEVINVWAGYSTSWIAVQK